MKKSINTANAPGFLTIIAIFMIISLVYISTAALSVTAGGGRLTQTSVQNHHLYREAKNLSELRLSRLDGCVAAAANSGLFDLNFEAMAAELDFADVCREGEYYIVSCTTPIDENRAVFWKVRIDAIPKDSRGCMTVIEKRVMALSDNSEEDDGSHLNVWLG